MKKQLNELTLSEFERYQELLSNETRDIYSVMELFGYIPDKMSVSEFAEAERNIAGMYLKPGNVKKVYNIKGRRFKAHLNMTNIKASQFIDFQSYMQNFKLQEVLSVFLIPQKRNWFGKWVTHKYNTGYDIFEVQEYLKNNFTIGEANSLSAFFLTQSNDLLKVMNRYLAKKEILMRWKVVRALLKAE